MRKPFVHGVGGVLSADIAVPDHERELAFYTAILTTGDAPLWRDDLMNNIGSPVIGLGLRTPDYDRLPLQWMPHFQVADVANSVAEATKLGGKVLMQSPNDEWAVLTDQVGAAFGLIPVVAGELGAAGMDEPCGRICWLSLTVVDAEQCQDFYQRVVGWKAKSIKTEDSERLVAKFEMLIDSKTAAADICQFRRDENDLPSVWLIHLPVDDLVESLRRVSEMGGKIIKESADAKCAIVRDPVGVYLALHSG